MNKNNLAPIILFVYNRPWHTEQAVNALKKNNLAINSDLFIFSDGSKSEKDKKEVKEVREYLKTISGFKNIKIVERVENIGLANSVILGVTEIINEYGKSIVLEDDLIVHSSFLDYMNQALNLYQDNVMVGSINAWLYPLRDLKSETVFLRVSDSYGWGTWKDRWELLNKDATDLYKQIKKKGLVRKFDIDGSYPFFQMLKGQIKGLNSSWAIRWYASLFLQDKVNLYYGKSLVKNIGWDNTGTHTGGVDIFKGTVYEGEIGRIKLIEVKETPIAIKKLKRYFRSPKMFIIFKLIKIRNFFRMILIDLGIRKRKK